MSFVAWYLIYRNAHSGVISNSEQVPEKSRSANIYLWLSICLYILSLTQVGWYGNRNSETGGEGSYGIALVFWGALNTLDGGMGLIWLANPLLWFSWRKRSNLRLSLLTSAIATFICLSFLLFDGYTSSCGNIWSSTTCEVQITCYGWGYYLWIASFAVFLLGQCLKCRLRLQN